METQVATAKSKHIIAPQKPVDTRKASLKAMYIIWYRDIIRYFRDRTRLIASLAQPILFLIVFGTGLGSSLRAIGGFAGTAGSFQYTQYIYPGIIGMAALFTSMFSAMSIVWDREFGFLKEVLIAPVDRWAIVVGKTLGGATQALIQGLILLVLAPLVGVHLDLMSVLKLIPLLFFLSFSLTALGVAIASRLTTMQGFQAIMNFLIMPLFFLSGALFPLYGLPGWMNALTHIDPAAYGIDPIRKVLLTGPGYPPALVNKLGVSFGNWAVPIPVEVVILLAFGLIMLAAGIQFLRRSE